MLLKSIELKNFRQFRNAQPITFATDNKKNVTIIMAENGVGKTTLAQAFQWVLYANVDGFRNKSVLNLKEEKEMNPGETREVEVKLDLEHSNIEYCIVRTQKFYKEGSGRTRSNPSELKITYKNDDGQTEFVEETKKYSVIKEILPEELSKYFFFDGERINRMSTEINDKGKSSDFAEAVESLLGLKPLKQLIRHLKPSIDSSVIGKFDEEIDNNGDQNSRKLSEKIHETNKQIEFDTNRVNEIKDQIIEYSNKRERIKNDLLKCADVEKLQEKATYLEKEIETHKQLKNQKIQSFIKQFNSTMSIFLQRKLIEEAMQDLANAGKIDEGIPYVRDETIKFLLERKRCLCGADLSDTSSECFKNLIKELDYVPPISLGGSIKNFVEKSKDKIKFSENYYSIMTEYYKDIRRYKNNIEEEENQRSNIDDNILKNNKANEFKREQKDCEEQIERLENEKIKRIESLAVNKQILENDMRERERLTNVNEKNRKVQLYRKYALRIYEDVEKTYRNEEAKTREELKKAINTLFEKIYGKGMYIDVDEQYHIKVLVNELSDDENFNDIDIDYSTAQSYSVIFAFIVGILELAKKRTANNEEHLIETEEYPLVMDAPLSAFDQHRIKNICDTIPGIARQVIIIIKDTDGNIAKENLTDFIGKEYEMKAQEFSDENHSVVESYIKEKGVIQ